MSAQTLSASEAPRPVDLGHRLLVTCRDDEGRFSPIAFLEFENGLYSFAYLDRAVRRDGFRPLPGFGNPYRRYFSERLFPLFSERIISARRPDRPHLLDALNLAQDPEPWAVLARSGGRRAGDAIEVLPVPVVSVDGSTSCTFLVHGVRYAGDHVESTLRAIHAGTDLRLQWEPENPINTRAVLVLAQTGERLGWVPDPLVNYVHQAMAGSSWRLQVVRSNGPEVGPHFRLLVRLEALGVQVSDPFAGPDWIEAAPI